MHASKTSEAETEFFDLKLYVAGPTPQCVRAIDNLRVVCDELLPGRHHITIIDLLEDPKRAREDQIVAIPTLVRKLPEPVRRVIGDLSDKAHVVIGLEIRSADQR